MPNHVHGVVLIGDNHDHDHLSRVVGVQIAHRVPLQPGSRQ
jgi:hypothetical protein